MNHPLSRSRRKGLTQAILLGILAPVFFVVLALIWQPRVGEVVRLDWETGLGIFIVGAAVVALPRQLPMIAILVVLLAAAWLSTTPVSLFGGFSLMMFGLAGFFFGIAVRSLLFQWKHWKTPKKQ